METTTSDPRTRSHEYAGKILRRIFGSIQPGIRYRLWDGSEHTIGKPDDSFTLVIRDRASFREAFASGNTRALAEAFIDNKIDVEGDLFAALRFVNALENVELTFADRVGILLDRRRV